MKIEIELHSVKDGMPEPFTWVLVDGGVAIWDGTNWLSQMASSVNRKIEWEVKWWTPLIYHDMKLTHGYHHQRAAPPNFP